MVWKTHPVYTDYQVSNCGQVRSTDKLINHNYGGKSLRKGITLSQHTSKRGYVNTGLAVDGKHRTIRVHRLVAETWVENPESKPHVNHIDLNKSNNNSENLEWCSQSENMKHYWVYIKKLKQRIIELESKLKEHGIKY